MTPTTSVIETHGLSKTFGRRPAVTDLDLTVSAGQVFGYLGPNGAGKTTTIRLVVGLLRPSAGTARVLGLDVVRSRDLVQRRVGYLPGDFRAYPELTATQYLRFLGALRGGVDWSTVQLTAKRLDLDLERRIRTMSHGNRQKIGIVQAVMHRPELVVLDEPTSGLDPLVQREFLELVRSIRDDGRTVFLSSHVLSEVEQVADTVGMLRGGSLVLVDSVGHLKSRARRRLDLTFERTPPAQILAHAPGVRDTVVSGSTVHVVVEGSAADLLAVAAPYRVRQIVSHEPDLEEIFLAAYDGER